MATKKKVVKRKTAKKAVKKSGSKKIGTMGSKIMAKAKQIRKANPNLEWTSCVSKAAKSI
jgi:hypothetical protein